MVMYEVLTETLDLFKKITFNVEVKIALDESFRPPVPLEYFENQQYHDFVKLMTSCWKDKPEERPTTDDVFKKLNDIKNSVK